jgi:predicted PurR-regulated permease PerM
MEDFVTGRPFSHAVGLQAGYATASLYTHTDRKSTKMASSTVNRKIDIIIRETTSALLLAFLALFFLFFLLIHSRRQEK